MAIRSGILVESRPPPPLAAVASALSNAHDSISNAMDPMLSMTLEQLRATAAAGGVAGVTLKGKGGAFMLRIATRSGQDAVLTKARSSELRRFGHQASDMILLREVGIAVAQLDAQTGTPTRRT